MNSSTEVATYPQLVAKYQSNGWHLRSYNYCRTRYTLKGASRSSKFIVAWIYNQMVLYVAIIIGLNAWISALCLSMDPMSIMHFHPSMIAMVCLCMGGGGCSYLVIMNLPNYCACTCGVSIVTQLQDLLLCQRCLEFWSRDVRDMESRRKTTSEMYLSR